MCSPEKSRHTCSSANHAGSITSSTGLFAPMWAGYFDVSAGSDSHPQYKPILGPGMLSCTLDCVRSGENTFYVEGLAFPDAGFSGLVSINVSLLEVPHKVRGIYPFLSPQSLHWGYQPLLLVFCPCSILLGPPFSRIQWFSAWRPG